MPLKPTTLITFACATALSLLLLFAPTSVQAARRKVTQQQANINVDAAIIFDSNNAHCAKDLDALHPSPALIAAQPNWLRNNICLLQALIVAVQENRFPYRFQYREAVSSRPAKLKIQLEGNFEETSHLPVYIPLATYACMVFDFRARVAGAWGSECRVLKVINPLGKVTEAPVPFPGAEAEKQYEYSWKQPGKHSIRFLVENGAGKKIDCTVIFNIALINDKG